MKIYLVNLEAKPSPGSEEFDQVGGAQVYSFVKSTDIVDATQKAIAYVLSRAWVVTEQRQTLLITPAQIAEMDTAQNAAYRRAQVEGLYSSNRVSCSANNRPSKLQY